MKTTDDINDTMRNEGEDAARERFDNAKRYKRPEPEGPRPLMRELPPAELFPVDALGDVLGAAARAIHDRVQAPLAIGAQSVLAAATLAVQGYVDVALPFGNGRAKPVSDYFVTIAVSGERKSECDTQAIWPIEKYERKLREQYDSDLPSYLNDKEAWDKARECIKKSKSNKGNRTKIKDELDALGPAPTAPLQPMLTCPEPTYEGLWKLFATGQPSLGLFSTEGGQFIGGHGMSADHQLKTAAGISEIWDGKPMRRVRAGDGASILPGRRLSTHLMVQPEVADILLGNRLIESQGLLSRMLVVYPTSAIGTRESHAEHPHTDRDLKQYDTRLLGILERPLPLVPNTTNELEPRILSLTPMAGDCLIKFSDHIEKAMRPGGEFEPVRALANKLPEHAARIASVLSAVADIECPAIEIPEIRAGIAIAEHYIAEALRLAAASRISNELRLAQRLLGWLLHNWEHAAISLPDIYQRSLNAIGDLATAKKMVGILEEHGWLERIEGGAVVAEIRRRDAWLIVGKGVSR